jgi:glycosyltransferase involved in cell wall biosynthesis
MKVERLSIAYISPLNPTPSGISDYSEMLIPCLAEHMDIVLFHEGQKPSNISHKFPVYPIQELYNQRSRLDLRLYQVGNSPCHRGTFGLLRTLPGVVVLHEPFLHHGLYYCSPLHYRRELFCELGAPDWVRLRQMEQALFHDDRQALLDVPLISRIVDSSLGILVHSQTARQIVEACRAKSAFCRPDLPKIMVVSHLMPVLDSGEIPEHRARLGLPQDALIFGMAGFIHPVKEPYLALQAFARLRSDFPQALFLFIGEVLQETGDLLAFASDLGLADKVMILGRVEPLERLHQAMSACDVILNLRRTTIGETSAIALRAMALGKPVVVRNTGWFSELPDEACVKIGPEDGVEELVAVMRALASSPEMRLHLGQEARRYVERECDPRRVARQYAEFLWDVYLSVGQSQV